ncbi:hypothetical protein B6D52_01585 [Candidatus Parcubacteria bacterium 4484_255]|nr:MAG: hypothetical protein B6D52_01585 [Candidatus Parcubacteria bacterium 4484_255]
MRKISFVNEEYYHIYNRGVDKRTIFECQEDLDRFFESMKEFNVIEPIGSIYANSLNIKRNKKFRSSAPKLFKKEKLVEFICYCLNPNHYHFILQQLVDDGIPKFMHRMGTGYTNYFNDKYKRDGSLCQGKYRAIHVNSNEYLLHLSVYVNLNYKVHNLEKFRSSAPKLFKSSWGEYINDNKEDFCKKDIILDQFGSAEDYRGFAEDSLKRIKENKQIKNFLLE